MKRYNTTATFGSRYSRKARRARDVFRPLPRALCFQKESEPNGLPVRSTRRLLGAALRASPDTHSLSLCVCVTFSVTPFAPLVRKTQVHQWRTTIFSTSRTRQETTLSPRGLAPGARVFATCGLRDRKALANSEGLKKLLAKSKRRKKSYVRFKMGTQNHQWGKRGHGPDRSQNHVILVHLPVVHQKESPTSRINSNSRCGLILTRIGAYEN